MEVHRELELQETWRASPALGLVSGTHCRLYRGAAGDGLARRVSEYVHGHVYEFARMLRGLFLPRGDVWIDEPASSSEHWHL